MRSLFILASLQIFSSLLSPMTVLEWKMNPFRIYKRGFCNTFIWFLQSIFNDEDMSLLEVKFLLLVLTASLLAGSLRSYLNWGTLFEEQSVLRRKACTSRKFSRSTEISSKLQLLRISQRYVFLELSCALESVLIFCNPFSLVLSRVLLTRQWKV